MTSPLCYRECMIKMRVPKIIITDMADSARGTSFAPCSNTHTHTTEAMNCQIMLHGGRLVVSG